MDEINRMLADFLVGIFFGWESTCGVKVAHYSEDQARRHADELNRGIRRTREPYACVWCWHWHVGRKINSSHISHIRGLVIKRQAGGEDDQT